MKDRLHHWRARPLRSLAGVTLAVVVAWTVGAIAHGHNGPAVADSVRLAAQGAVLFATRFTSGQGLGPLFNDTSCVGCHTAPTPGGVGPGGLGTATRVGKLTAAGFDAMSGRGGPIARARSVTEEGRLCDLTPGIPRTANVTSVRNAPALYGSGLIDAIPDEVIAGGAVPRGDGVHGRAHRLRDIAGRERVGRFGWKADTATLQQFVGDALRNELGITNPFAPVDLAPAGQPGRLRCPGEGASVEDDGTVVNALTAFVAALPPPVTRVASLRGSTLFRAIGCNDCHTPSLSLGNRSLWLYSDLLLHDLGPDLDDKVVQGQAGGRDWRTTPLWGLGTRPRLLHDGRAHTIAEAVYAHGGEAAGARERFRVLGSEERDALLAFLAGL